MQNTIRSHRARRKKECEERIYRYIMRAIDRATCDAHSQSSLSFSLAVDSATLVRAKESKRDGGRARAREKNREGERECGLIRR